MRYIAATIRHRYCVNISPAHGKHDQNNNFIAYHYYTYIAGKTKKSCCEILKIRKHKKNDKYYMHHHSSKIPILTKNGLLFWISI